MTKPWEETWTHPYPPDEMTSIQRNGRNVAICVRREDAPFIAAAPELYRALADMFSSYGGGADDPDDDRRMLANAEAALRKARGE